MAQRFNEDIKSSITNILILYFCLTNFFKNEFFLSTNMICGFTIFIIFKFLSSSRDYLNRSNIFFVNIDILRE